MDLYLLLKAIGFLLLVIIGIPGNVFIMVQFTYFRIIEKKLLPTNIILMVLALVNLLVILSRIIPQSINALGVEELLDDTECKFVIFTYRVNRAMSICVTSFLSCYQCILIAPNTKLWIYFKHNVTQNVVAIISLFWIINIAIYPYSIFNARTRRNQTTSPYTLHLVYCDADFLNYMAYIVNGAIYSIRDFIFVGLMALASSYIVFILLSHDKSVKGIRSSDRTQRRSVEYRASKAVILLVALYVLLYGLDNSSSYSSLSPIVIIITNPKLQRKWCTCNREKNRNSEVNGQVYFISK
ncbi:hypothetical protein XELAEV_18014653mg [Xenopus laevis]|uniref:Vomeronasal type-1 receptor n=1 Tax=Xenopus laevis TaxID=8355 RepID=A0A974HV72_XENLA|nr:hypothetical protein XELAEV_18014653mg [Xenopus laevis]